MDVKASDTLRFRSICSLNPQEASALLNEIEPQQVMQQMGLHSIHQSFQQIPTTTSVVPPPAFEPINNSRRKLQLVRKSQIGPEQSRINQLVRPLDPNRLRQEYTALWYEKLALESSAERLLQDGRKKDDLIAQLTLEVQQMRSRRII